MALSNRRLTRECPDTDPGMYWTLDRFVVRRLFPKIDTTLHRVAIDLGKLIRREISIFQRCDIFLDLFCRASADQS